MHSSKKYYKIIIQLIKDNKIVFDVSNDNNFELLIRNYKQITFNNITME